MRFKIIAKFFSGQSFFVNAGYLEPLHTEVKMSRLLYYGCTRGNDVASLQNDLNVITGHTQQGSAMAPLTVDGIFGSKTLSRVLEFQRLNGLVADGIVGDHTRSKLDELFLSQPGLQIKRTRGGIAGSDGGVSGIKQGEQVFGKMPPAGSGVAKGGNTSKGTGGGWGKGGSGYGGSGVTKSMGTGASGQGKIGSTTGYKTW